MPHSSRVRIHLLSTLVSLACLLMSSAAYPQTRFRGRPLPECRSFWITEVGVTSGSATRITGEVGHMVNVSPRFALGATVVGALGIEAASSVGMNARARVWLNPSLSVELSPGVSRYHYSSGYTATGMAVQIGLNFGDWISLTGQMEDVSGAESGGSVGLKVGSYPGVIGFGLGAILGVLAAVAVAGAG